MWLVEGMQVLFFCLDIEMKMMRAQVTEIQENKGKMMAGSLIEGLKIQDLLHFWLHTQTPSS